MLQSKKGKLLIVLTAVSLLITSAFYAMTARQVTTNEAIGMVNVWKDKNLDGGHWVHLVFSVTSHEENGVVLPSGQTIPLSYINDDWYFLNEAGLVEKGVFTMKDINGNILQQSAFRNNVMVNFTFADRQENIQPYPLNVDLGFEALLQEAQTKNLVIRKSDDKVKGKPSLAFSYVEKLQLPTQLSGKSVVVDSITIKGDFDKKTSDLLQLQTILNLEDGTEVVNETVLIISVDSSPIANDEILEVLEAVK